MTTLHITLETPGSETQALVIESDRVLVGTGAHCEVRLPAGTAATEELLVLTSRDGLLVQRLGGVSGRAAEGKHLEAMPCQDGTVLDVGPHRLTLRIVAGKAAPRSTAPSALRARTWLLAALGLGAAGWLWLQRPTSARRPSGDPSAGLFGATAAPCPESEPARAADLAAELAGRGEVREQRWPFYPATGIAAVTDYQGASACFLLAQRGEEAQYWLARAAYLRATLEAEHRTHHVRLDYSLLHGEHAVAEQEVKALLQYRPSSSDENTQWLTSTLEELQHRLAAEKDRRP